MDSMPSCFRQLLALCGGNSFPHLSHRDCHGVWPPAGKIQSKSLTIDLCMPSDEGMKREGIFMLVLSSPKVDLQERNLARLYYSGSRLHQQNRNKML